MNFSDRVLNQIHRGKLSDLNDWIADIPSWQSAPSELGKVWMPHVENARQALIVIFLSSFRPFWETDAIFRRLGNLAYINHYQGAWRTVQDCLETNFDTLKDERFWLKIQSPDEFFGNFLREANRLLRFNKFTWRAIDYDARRRPKARVRRRGYQDKGTLLPSHKKGRIYGSDDPGEDRRSLIKHPLLLRVEGDGDTTHPSSLIEKKGEDTS